MSRPTPIVVTGMHRSGTSVVAKALEVMGYNLGKKMMNTSEANPKGYQENQYTTIMSEAVMHRCGLDWDQPAAIKRGFENSELMDEIWERGNPLLENEFPGDTRIVWKDPRVCLTLPFWTRFMGEKPLVIGCIRSPVEVAKSLWERERMSAAVASTLWKTHTAALVRNAPECLWVDYGEALVHPKKVWDSIYVYLRDNDADAEANYDKYEEWAEYIDKRLHRNKSTPKELFSGKYDFGAVALYLKLVDASLEDIANATVGA